MKKPVIVLGAGGHAKVLVRVLKLQGVRIQAILDSSPSKVGTEILGERVTGTEEALSSVDPKSVLLVNAVGSTGNLGPRRAVFERAKERGFSFMTLVDPSAIVAEDVVVEEGAQILAGAVLQPGSSIGKNSIINTRAAVDHDCRIGANTHVAPGATLSGGASVGDEVHIGTGAVLIQGVRVGSRCVIGAGAVVIREIPDGMRAFGNPAHQNLTQV